MADVLYEKFIQIVRNHFEKMCEDNDKLFVTDVDGSELWKLYLGSIPEKENPIFRERRLFDCSSCRQFVERSGNVVAVKDGKLESIWDIDVPDFYGDVVDVLSKRVKSAKIRDLFLTPFSKMGVKSNYDRGTGDDDIIIWRHLFAEIPNKYVKNESHILPVLGEARTTKAVFERALEEIDLYAIDTVLELIDQNSLYRGEEKKDAVTEFRKYCVEYEDYRDKEERDNYLWEKSAKAGDAIARIGNSAMGTLLKDISANVDLDTAVTKWEKIMAPANYKRPKAIYTPQMLEDAKAKIAELGYMESLPRRFATLNDITVNNVLFSNKDAAKRMPGATAADDFFSDMEKSAVVDPRKFSRVQQIGIEDIVEKVLPTARNIEVFFENKHAANLVSLIAPVNMDAPSMFKWGNAFSWAYSGNLADSKLKERVKAAGGDVTGVLRFSIQWNDIDGSNNNDEDAHCIEPSGSHIYFGRKRNHSSGGVLDVDIIRPNGKVAVENITWPSLSKMDVGDYRFYVHTFSGRGGHGGFRAEIETHTGERHTYDYSLDTKDDARVDVATVTLTRDGEFIIHDILPAGFSTQSQEHWGISTNQFVPVSVICYSPNYWDEQHGIGNKHYFFMLKDCVNDEEPNGFYNEQLRSDLNPHRRVLEMLGSKAHVNATPDQLSGLGFSSTKKAELVVKVQGATERLLKIVF